MWQIYVLSGCIVLNSISIILLSKMLKNLEKCIENEEFQEMEREE